MSMLDETRFVERLQFFNGQRLFAPDLQGIDTFNREMRWLHNQSLHQPGIGNGFAVSGKKGDREITIGAGYAIDAKGREVILTETQTEPVPPVAGEKDGLPVMFDLVVSYPDDASLDAVETRDAACPRIVPRGTVRRREQPVLCWVRLQRGELDRLTAVNTKLQADIDAGMRIVIARIAVLNCQLDSLSVAQRRSARPPQQPRIVCGVADPTTWVEMDLSLPRDAVAVLTASIDTRDAAFTVVPQYSVSVPGSRLLTVRPSANADEVQVLVIDRLATTDATRDGFTVWALLQFVSTTGRNAPAITAVAVQTIKQLWQVTWMGIEG